MEAERNINEMTSEELLSLYAALAWSANIAYEFKNEDMLRKCLRDMRELAERAQIQNMKLMDINVQTGIVIYEVNNA